MSNICLFEMVIRGKSDKVEKFMLDFPQGWIDATFKYPATVLSNGEIALNAYGRCRGSVASTLRSHGLEEKTMEYGLVISCASYEAIEGFSERLFIDKGEVLIDARDEYRVFTNDGYLPELWKSVQERYNVPTNEYRYEKGDGINTHDKICVVLCATKLPSVATYEKVENITA